MFRSLRLSRHSIFFVFSLRSAHKYKLLVIVHNSRVSSCPPYRRRCRYTNIWKSQWFVEQPKQVYDVGHGLRFVAFSFRFELYFHGMWFGDIVLLKLSINGPVYLVNFDDQFKNTTNHLLLLVGWLCLVDFSKFYANMAAFREVMIILCAEKKIPRPKHKLINISAESDQTLSCCINVITYVTYRVIYATDMDEP